MCVCFCVHVCLGICVCVCVCVRVCVCVCVYVLHMYYAKEAYPDANTYIYPIVFNFMYAYVHVPHYEREVVDT